MVNAASIILDHVRTRRNVVVAMAMPPAVFIALEGKNRDLFHKLDDYMEDYRVR